MPAHTKLRAALEARLVTLVDRVGRIERDLRQPHDRDWSERAIELENDEVLEGLDDLGRAEAREIQGALRRMRSGDYGFCVECRRPIDEKRLRAVPTATRCIYCAP